MLLKCCILPSRHIKSANCFRGSALDPTGGAHSPPPNPLAGFNPILCLVVFFIGPNCVRISLSPHFKIKINTHPTKNDLTSWAAIRLGGPIRFGARYRPSYPLENFLSEALVVGNVLYFPTWAKSLTKFNSKMQDFERVLD